MYTFGDLLRRFRVLENMSQKGLADELHMNRNTVVSWEGGDYLPKERETVLRLAEVLSLSPVETNNLLIAANFPQEYQDQKTKEQWLYEAHLLLSGGNSKDALVAYEEVLRLASKDTSIHFEKGKVLYDLKDYKGALSAFEQAIYFDSSNASAYYYRSDSLYHLQEFEKALEAIERAINLDSHFEIYHFNKGKILQQLGRHDEALKAYKRAISLNPNNAYFYNKQGEVLRSFRRYEEALASCEQAIQLDPKFAEAYFGKGVALSWLRRYDEALAAYDQALRLDPYIPVPVHHYRASALIHLGRLEEAELAKKLSQQLRPR